MDDNDIYMLFSRVSEDAGQADESVKEVFSTLIKTTLRYRDSMLKSEGIIVTVNDVRSALDYLVPTIETGRLPQTENRISLDLLKLWLDEIRRLSLENNIHK